VAQQLRTRGHVGLIEIGAAMAVVAAPLLSLLRYASIARFSGHLQLFASGMVSPMLLLLPLAMTVITCRRFSAELHHRFISLRRCRLDMTTHLRSRMRAALRTGFVLGFLCAGVTYATAFHVWPLIGDPEVDPASYSLTAAQETAQSVTAVSFSHFLALGDWVYGLTYSAWLGSCCAVYALVGMTALLYVRNRFLAAATPMLIVLLETLTAALLGQPRYGLYYSALPFALTASSDLVAASPTLVLAAAVMLVAVVTVRRIPYSGRLA
jgi:hypothetical protein